MQEATHKFGDSLTDCRSPLPASASKQQIIDAEAQVINRFGELREGQREIFQLVETRVQVVLSQFQQLEEMAVIFGSSRGLSPADINALLDNINALHDIEDEAKNGIRVYEDVSAESHDLGAQNLLQIGLRELVSRVKR